jgi:hypothetical protein
MVQRPALVGGQGTLGEKDKCPLKGPLCGSSEVPMETSLSCSDVAAWLQQELREPLSPTAARGNPQLLAAWVALDDGQLSGWGHGNTHTLVPSVLYSSEKFMLPCPATVGVPCPLPSPMSSILFILLDLEGG